jgi:hypothetical protein
MDYVFTKWQCNQMCPFKFTVWGQTIFLVRERVLTLHGLTYACILKAHSHSYSMSVSSIWASLEGQRCFGIAGGVVSYLTMWLLTLQLFKNNTDTQEKLRLNLPPLIECEWAFRIQAYVNPWSVNTLSLTRKIVCPQTVNLKSRAHLVALPLGEHIVHGQIVW